MFILSFPIMMSTLYGLSRALVKIKLQKDKVTENKMGDFGTIRGAIDYVSNVSFSQGISCSLHLRAFFKTYH